MQNKVIIILFIVYLNNQLVRVWVKVWGAEGRVGKDWLSLELSLVGLG